MIHAKVGFVVYGVHKDGLLDPMGVPFIDDSIVAKSKQALKDSGLELVENDLIVATKEEAKKVILPLAKDDSVDALVLFSATWVWSAHMIQAIREFAKTGKGIVIWTYPGSQGWRPVGGLVLKAALNEIGIKHRYVYGKEIIEIPAGKRDGKDEDTLVGAKRELKEELGIEAENFYFLGELYPTPGYTDEILFMYAATSLTFGETSPDEDEFIESEKIHIDTLVSMIMDGEIKDAKTVAAVLKTKKLLDEGKI